MLNPLDIEQRYQDLLLSLSLPGTPFQRLCVISDFLENLIAEAPTYESYILDCFTHVSSLVTALPHWGQDPEVVRRIHGVLHFMSQQVRLGEIASTVEASLVELKQLVWRLYCYAGAWTQLNELLGSPLHGIGNFDSEHCTGGRRGALRQLIATMRNGKTKTVLEEIRREWDALLVWKPGVAFVPVVERSFSGGRDEGGSIRRLSVKIFGENREGSNGISTTFMHFGANQEENGFVGPAFDAARSWFRKADPALAEKFFDGQITFGDGQELHEGDSGRLAAMTLLVCEILRHADRRLQYRLRPNVALTGSVDTNGVVLAVDTESLRSKVVAAFFSHIELLVVPRCHLADAERALHELQVRYPGRHLDIVGIDRGEEVFYDRRIIEETRLPLVIHMAHKLLRHKTGITAAISATGLVLIAARLALGPFDSRPASVEFVGETMEIRNQYGETIKAAQVDLNTATFLLNDQRSAKQLPRFELLTDDGNDLTAVVFTGVSREDGSGADEVRKWSISREQYEWIWRPFPAVDFPLKNHEAQGAAHLVDHIAFSDVDNVTGQEVLVVTHHPNSFPATLTALDRHQGVPTAEYLHVGFINDIKVFDIDADGVDEILICGINNAYRMAFVAALDPRSMGGCSPTTGDYICRSHPAASEEAYILIPRTFVGETSSERKNNTATLLEIDQIARQIVVRVEEYSRSAGPGSSEDTASLNYRFDSTMCVVNIAPGDDYDLLAERLVSKGAIRTRPGAEDFQTQARAVLYWEQGTFRRKTPLKPAR